LIVLGLTGSIGMGKTTTARLFAEEGVRVHDADQAVHELYAPGGKAAAALEAAFPGVVRDGAVDRQALAQRITGDAEALKRLEAIVHPLVAATRDELMARARAEGADVVVLDVPLLFETGGHERVDAVVVASAPEPVQRERVMARPGMTEEKFQALLARQTPDAEKRRKADFVVDSGRGIEAAREQVRRILATVRDPAWRAGRQLAGGREAPH
jgi:dephospho-CoA kinase